MLPHAVYQEFIRSLALVGGLTAFLLLGGCADLIQDAARGYRALIPDSFEDKTDNSLVLADKGYEQIEAGNYRGAEAYLDAALAANPTNPYALLNLGVVYEKTGRLDEARALYAKVIQLDPQIPIEESTDEGALGTSLADLARRNLAALAQGPGTGPAATAGEGLTRLGVLEHLYAQKMITAEEFDSRRSSATVAASAGAPSPVGIGEAVRKLHELEAFRESVLITPQAYTAERLALLDSLSPPAVPAPLAATGAAVPIDTVPLAPPQPSLAPASGGYRLHVASYRSAEAARAGWSELSAANADLLGPLTVEISPIDLGPEQGVYYRVQAGPVADAAMAKDLCTELKSRNIYCTPVLPQTLADIPR